jgi:hypothetical protein
MCLQACAACGRRRRTVNVNIEVVENLPCAGETHKVCAAEYGRFVFAFDSKASAILLCGGDKSGGSEQGFYRQLITKADDRFDAHLADLKTLESPDVVEIR